MANGEFEAVLRQQLQEGGEACQAWLKANGLTGAVGLMEAFTRAHQSDDPSTCLMGTFAVYGLLRAFEDAGMCEGR